MGRSIFDKIRTFIGNVSVCGRHGRKLFVGEDPNYNLKEIQNENKNIFILHRPISIRVGLSLFEGAVLQNTQI